MTADIDLLPLGDPEGYANKGPLYWNDEAMTDYARANMAPLIAEIERLQDEIDNRWAQGVHSCHDNCQRIACVQRREIEALRAKVAEAYAAVDSKAGWEWKKRAEQAEDRLGDIIHQASNTSNGVRTVLRQHTKGFSRTILRNVRTKENPMWCTLEHQEYRLDAQPGGSDNDR